MLPSNNGTTVFGKRSKIKDQSSVARPLPVYSPQPVQPVYHQQAALQQPGFPHSPAPAQIPAPGSGSRPQDRRSQRDGHGQVRCRVEIKDQRSSFKMYCRPPGISGSGAPPPPPPGPSAGSGLRVRPGSETGGLSVRPTSEDEGSRIDVVVMRPGKTKVR